MTQAAALDILKMGHNVFLTGSAGSGKTYVLNALVRYLRSHKINVAVTASTGIAATHLGGMTIHAWSGIGIKDFLSDYDIDILESKKYLWDRYQETQVLIIDEISMLSGTFLDTLDRVCRTFKRNYEKPFGGMQLILCGDLFQLPPVEGNFIFQSDAWKKSNLAICYLTEQHRQDDDAFLSILNAIRAQSISDHHHTLLNNRIREYDDNDFSSITKLFTHNVDVDAINNQELAKIDEKEHRFMMTAQGKDRLIETLKKSCLAPEELRLKIGAQVMFVKNNFEKGFVNGTRGEIVDFDEMGTPIVKTMSGKTITADKESWAIEDEGRIIASINQIPLRHAWAITVHKSQGMSLDQAVIDLSKSFTYGMGYVALSRVRTLDGLHLVGFRHDALQLDPRIFALDKQLQELSIRAEKRLEEFSPSEIDKNQSETILRFGGILEPVTHPEKNYDYVQHEARTPTHEITVNMINEGKTIEQIAMIRDLTTGTIIGHLDKAKALGLSFDMSKITIDPELIPIIKEAFAEHGTEKLSPVKGHLTKQGYDITFDTLKLARLLLNQ